VRVGLDTELCAVEWKQSQRFDRDDWPARAEILELQRGWTLPCASCFPGWIYSAFWSRNHGSPAWELDDDVFLSFFTLDSYNNKIGW